MRILPVIDLLGGSVVHAIAGQRNEYQPIQSVLASGASPRSIGTAFFEQLGATSAYVADLDAIGGNSPDWDNYQQISAGRLCLWVDAGIDSAANAARFETRRNEVPTVERMIIGLESLPEPASIEQIVDQVGSERLVFSLDLRAGELFTSSPAWQNLTAIEAVQNAIAAGVSSVIVLDLAHVGTGKGVGTQPLCRELRNAHPHVLLVAGGGVRNLEDLHGLKRAGCDAVLISSAIHSGRITRAMLEDAGYSL